MSLRDLAASAQSAKKPEPVVVTIKGDKGEATSAVTTELLTEEALLRGWELDPALWQIEDGSLVVNKWMTSSRNAERDGFIQTWNYQYKARIRRRVELLFVGLPTTPKGCGKCAGRKHKPAPRSSFDITYHVIIGDTQLRPGVPNDHLAWVGRYIRDEFAGKKTKIIHLGDNWDMPSLSQWSGAAEAEGQRVPADLRAGERGLEVLAGAAGDDPDWEWHFLFGNHEDRITRYVNANPPLVGFLTLDHCVTPEGWHRHPYREIVSIDGIWYSHFFYHPNTGKSYTGAIGTRLKELGNSFVMGHQQGLDIGYHRTPERSLIGVVNGACYVHHEDYKGPQGNHHFRGIVVLNDVRDGFGYEMPVDLDYLCRRYEGHRLGEHEGRVL